MGNLQTMCQDIPHSTTNIDADTPILKVILENRKEMKEVPRVPLDIQQLICKLLNINDLQEIYKQTKIWKVTHPWRFCYVNQSQHRDEGPAGICCLFIYQEKGEFIGFYRGNIDERGVREVKGSLYVFANGDYFVGDKEKQNYGVYTDKENKYQYQGDWVGGKPHGEGNQKSTKGIYEGYFKNGKKNGKGKFIFAGDKEGDFLDNEITGSGKISKGTSYQYTGEVLNGEKHGVGIEKNGPIQYDGHFYCNMRSGQGHLTNPSFEYQGEFLNGKPDGKGIMKKGGAKIQGIWEEGYLKAILQAAS